MGSDSRFVNLHIWGCVRCTSPYLTFHVCPSCATWMGIICNLRGYRIPPNDWGLSTDAVQKTAYLFTLWPNGCNSCLQIQWGGLELGHHDVCALHSYMPLCVCKVVHGSTGPKGTGPSLALVHCAKRTLGAHRASRGQMELLCGKSG